MENLTTNTTTNFTVSRSDLQNALIAACTIPTGYGIPLYLNTKTNEITVGGYLANNSFVPDVVEVGHRIKHVEKKCDCNSTKYDLNCAGCIYEMDNYINDILEDLNNDWDLNNSYNNYLVELTD